MRRNVLTTVASVFILVGMLVFFGGPQQAQASLTSDFGLTALSGYSNTFTFAAPLVKNGSDDHSVSLFATINVTDAAQDAAPQNNQFDIADIFGSWDYILDNSRIQNSDTEGIFLVIGKGKGAMGTADVVTTPQTFAVDPAVAGSPPKTGTITLNNQTLSFVNMGSYFWGTDPKNHFFNQKSVVSATIHVTGLQPATQYFAQIILKEDTTNPLSTHDIALSPVLAISTDATGQATAPTVADSQGSVGTSQDTPNPFTADLYCIKGGLTSGLQMSPGGCLNILFNDVFVGVSAWFAETTGRLFDAFAAVSLGSDIYGGAGISAFLTQSWSIVRDISNIFFIFILLYTALGLVLSLHHFDAKKLIAKVIIMGLLINFSLFFCRVAVDTSNILSRVFYNAMKISTTTTGNDPVTPVPGEQSMSAAIVQGVQPQKLLSQDAYDKMKKAPGGISNGTIFVILLMSFILNMVLAWIFFMCAAFFAGRVGVIWFSMIFAPLAFVSSIVPELAGKLKQLGWDTWLSTFMKACFNAPIFFFFMYLIVNLVGGPNGGVLSGILGAWNNPSLIAFFVGIMLPTMILIGLLMQAKKIAEDMAGEFGAAFAGVVAAGTGLAAMAVTGGAAALGSRTIGAAASNIAKNDHLKGVASGAIPAGKFEKWRAQKTLSAANSLKSSSFDLRQTQGGNALSKITGVNMNMGAGLVSGVTGFAAGVTGIDGLKRDLSTGARAGGYDAEVARRVEETNKRSEMFAGGFDEKAYRDQEVKIKERETGISDQEDVVSKKEDEVAKIKAEAAAEPNTKKKNALNKDAATKQIELNGEKDALRKMKKGSGDKVVEEVDPKTGKPTKTRDLKPSDVGKALHVLKGDGKEQKNWIVDRFEFADSVSLNTMNKNLENIKKARMKQYHLSLMEGSGRKVHGTTHDELGNIKDLGHMAHETYGEGVSRYWGNVKNDFAKNAAKGLTAGLATSVVAGPLAGAITAGFVTLAGSLKGSMALVGTDTEHDVAHHATSSEPHKHQHYTDTYKSPSAGLFEMFKGLGSSPSGGGGGHGGGGDHGGGGGGHH